MITVRRLSVHDTELATEVVAQLKLPSTRQSFPHNIGFIESFLEDDTNYLFVAIDDKRPIGFALCYRLPRIDTPQAMLYLHEISVIKECQRKGVGQMLMDAVIAAGRQGRTPKLFMVTDARNTAARRLFAATGATEDQDSRLYTYTFKLGTE